MKLLEYGTERKIVLSILVETCPECGHDLLNYIITCYPPIPVKYCPHCGWRYEDVSNEIIRVPFTPPNIRQENTYEHNSYEML